MNRKIMLRILATCLITAGCSIDKQQSSDPKAVEVAIAYVIAQEIIPAALLTSAGLYFMGTTDDGYLYGAISNAYQSVLDANMWKQAAGNVRSMVLTAPSPEEKLAVIETLARKTYRTYSTQASGNSCIRATSSSAQGFSIIVSGPVSSAAIASASSACMAWSGGTCQTISQQQSEACSASLQIYTGETKLTSAFLTASDDGVQGGIKTLGRILGEERDNSYTSSTGRTMNATLKESGGNLCAILDREWGDLQDTPDFAPALYGDRATCESQKVSVCGQWSDNPTEECICVCTHDNGGSWSPT